MCYNISESAEIAKGLLMNSMDKYEIRRVVRRLQNAQKRFAAYQEEVRADTLLSDAAIVGYASSMILDDYSVISDSIERLGELVA